MTNTKLRIKNTVINLSKCELLLRRKDIVSYNLTASKKNISIVVNSLINAQISTKENLKKQLGLI